MRGGNELLKGIKKNSYIFIISLLVMIVMLPTIVVNAKENRFFEIKEITGVAYIQKAGSMKSIRVAIGMELHQGDRIQTEEYSSILLQTGDSNDKVTIGEKTDISIVHLKENEGSKITNLKVWKGSVYADVTPVKNKNDRFQIISNDVMFDAKGTHFVVSIDPVTGLPTMFVSAGKVEVNEEKQPNNRPVTVLPSQQITYFPELNTGLSEGVNVVNPESIVQNTSPSIIEQLLKNKQQIDEENRELSTTNNPSELNLDSDEELRRYQQNIDNVLANLIKSSLDNGQMSQDEANRLIENSNNNNSSGLSKIDLNNISPLIMSEEEKNKQKVIMQLEDKQKQMQEEKERKQIEMQNQYQNILQRVKDEKLKLAEENRLMQEQKKKEAEEKMLAGLTEQQRNALENRLSQQEKQQKFQEESRKPSIPQPPIGGGSGPSPVNPDQLAANVVISKINTIPNLVTLEAVEIIKDSRESYDALTDRQKTIVTNLDKLIASELEIERLSKIQEITLKIVSEIEGNITGIQEINNAREARDIIFKTRLMINSLYEERIYILEELLTYFEDEEVKLVVDIISDLTESYDEDQIAEVRNIYNELSQEQKSSVTNKDVLFEMEVNSIQIMVEELSEMDSISIDHIEEIDYIKHNFDRLEEEQIEKIEEHLKEKIEQLVVEKENFLSNEGNLDDYIYHLSTQQNQQNIQFLYNIYQQENLTEVQQENILSALDMYISERSIYHFNTESLDYSNDSQFVFLTDGNNAVYIPLYSNFENIIELKEYATSYLEDKILVDIHVNEEDGMYAKASLPNFYLLYYVLEYGLE